MLNLISQQLKMSLSLNLFGHTLIANCKYLLPIHRILLLFSIIMVIIEVILTNIYHLVSAGVQSS